MAVLAATLMYIISLTEFVQSGEEYLMTFPNKTDASLMAVTGSAESSCQVKYPIQLETKLTVAANSVLNYNPRLNTPSEHVTIVISVDDSSALSVYGRQYEATFIPLPVRALGTEYVVSNCYKSGTNMTSIVVITAYSKTTFVKIIFENEQTFTSNGRVYINVTTFSQEIGAFQSFVLLSENSFSRSRIVSDHVTAVYSGAMEQDVVTMYAQLLPVSHLGKTVHEYFDQTRMPHAAQIISVYNDARLNSSSLALRSLSAVVSYSKRNGYSEFRFSKPTLLMLCGENGMRGVAVLPPPSLFQTQVHLPMDGDTLIIIHPHMNNSVTVSVLRVHEKIRWSFIGGAHVGVVRTPSIPGESVTITARESFFVIASSEDHIYTAGYSFTDDRPRQDDDENDDIIYGVSAGTGVSVTAGMFACGAVYIRRRRRRQNRDRGNPPEDKSDNNPPPPPPPPPSVAV